LPNWIPITIDTLYEAKVAALIDALNSLAKATGQPDRVPGIVQGRVDHVRRKIMSCAGNRVDADPTTVPAGLRDLTVDLVIARLKIALEIALEDDERTALKAHEHDLNRIADCKDKVEEPDSPVAAPVEAGGGIETLQDGNSGASREELKGL